MFQKANYEKGLQTGYIVAGWDPYEGPQVYSVNLGGATLLRNYAMGGSGSGFIYGYVDANYREGMSFVEAKAFCFNAVSLAILVARIGTSRVAEGSCRRHRYVYPLVNGGYFQIFACSITI